MSASSFPLLVASGNNLYSFDQSYQTTETLASHSALLMDLEFVFWRIIASASEDGIIKITSLDNYEIPLIELNVESEVYSLLSLDDGILIS